MVIYKFRHSFTVYNVIFVSILHYLLYNLIKIGVICLSKRKKGKSSLDNKAIKNLNNNIESKDKKKDISNKDEKIIENDFKEIHKVNDKKVNTSINKGGKKSILLNFLICTVLFSGGVYFIASLFKYNSLGDIVNGLLLLGISIFLGSICFTNPTKRKLTSYLCLIVLFVFQLLGCLVYFKVLVWPTNNVGNFVGKSLSDIIEWSNENDIILKQEYEYSDLVPEYHIIYQNVNPNTKLNKIKQISVSISQGPSPYKEVVLPNMVGWNTDNVLEFIEKNHLTNVEVEFVKSTEKENTLIEQSETGNVMRNSEIKFTFSYGEERKYTEVKLIDLTEKTKFEAEFYLKQYGIKYEFNYDFSDKVERDSVISQDVKAGSMVAISGDDAKTVKITISKGPKIIVPDLKKMTVSEITDWIIDNNLKVEFKERYDDSVKANSVADVNYEKGDVVEENTLIIVTLSKGNLVMEKFESYSQFREWADTYGITYEEKHEFSDNVATGEVIKYSYEVGKTIKNGDVIIVTISDGKKVVVPNVVGLTKSSATTKLKNAGLGYNFVYKYSNSVDKGKVISQSISSGSEVSNGTTITVSISNGPKPENNNPGGGGSTTPTCTPKTYAVGRELNNIFFNYSGFDTVKDQIYSFFASNYPNVKINVVAVDGGDATSGSYIGGISPGDSVTSCNSTPYTIELAK